MISHGSSRARRRATAVLPLAVGPIRRIAGGGFCRWRGSAGNSAMGNVWSIRACMGAVTRLWAMGDASGAGEGFFTVRDLRATLRFGLFFAVGRFFFAGF